MEIPEVMNELDPGLIARFLEKTGKETGELGCRNWEGGVNSKGYGVLLANGRLELAHRVAYVLFVGRIPDGMFVLHKCDNPRCVNPDHLVLGTHADNMADMVAKGRQTAGPKNANARLSCEDVADLRELYKSGGYSYAELAIFFGISRSYVGAIIRGEYWRLPQAE